jgi:DNA-binding PadR family transcriptional regulator
MSPVRYALLSLLAREPSTGYDLAQHLNARIAPFWPVRYNQIYPELARLEEEGLVKHHVVESISYRPTKKVYEMTTAGREALQQWVLLPVEPAVMRDEFLLKIYNLWLVEPEQTTHQLREQRVLHVEREKEYEEHQTELIIQMGENVKNQRDPLFASIAVIGAGLLYERQYIAWCDHLLSILEPEAQ